MIVLSGPSASGKTEVAKLLSKKYGIARVVTTTTRDMRKGEKNHLDYHFVSKETFLKMIKEDKFVEYTEYNGNYYGSSKDEVRDDKVIAIEPVGMKKYISLNNPKIITFYLNVDEATRHQRMLDRGDSPDKAIKRIEEDKIRFTKENVPEVDYIVDTKNYNVEEVTDYVYKKYIKALNSK